MIFNVQFLAIFGEANVGLPAAQCLLKTGNQSDPELTLVILSIIYY